MFYDKKMRHRFMLNISLFALVHFSQLYLNLTVTVMLNPK